MPEGNKDNTNDNTIKIHGSEASTTNNRMELIAAIRSLKRTLEIRESAENHGTDYFVDIYNSKKK